MLRESQQRQVLGVVPVAVIDLGSSKDGSRQGQGGACHHRRLGRNKIAVVQGNLAKVGSHVLHLLVVLLLGNHELGEEVDSGVANGPFQGVEDVHLHLGEHAGIVQAAAHVVEFVNLRHTVLLVAVLGRDEESGTPDELVVLLIYYAA